MLRRNFWKLTLSLLVVLWAVTTLVPVKDIDFREYVRTEASARQAEFTKLLAQADERVAAKGAQSVYVALKQLGREQNLDLSQFFPQLNVGDVKNVEKRNNLILDELLRQSKGRVQLGLDLKGGIAFTLEVDESATAAADAGTRQAHLDKAIEIIGNRVNGLGVAEPIIRAIGENRIEVQLPGVSTRDNPDVVNSLKKPARLDFRLVMEGTGPMDQPPPSAPPGFEIMPVDEEDKHSGRQYTQYYVVKLIPEMTGENVEVAGATTDNFGGYEVILQFNDAGKRQFGDVTTANTGRLLGIVLDGKLYSAPRINEPITGGSARISGRFSAREAQELANVLNNPLDVPLQVKEMYEVGPSLAQDAIASGKLAFVVGAALTAAFIVVFYTAGGVLAVLAMTVNVLIMFGVMANIGATLTMPGIAGIVLTLAMSVDSNILIFERMREELKLGKNLGAALEAGYDKAFSAIFDGNITTLITAAIMAWLGNGPVKGFGVTLAIGIFTTMFAALVVSRLLLEAVIHGGYLQRMPMMTVLQNTSYDFLKWARGAAIACGVIVAAGIVTIAVKGGSIYGIDFTGGDQVSLSFAKKIDDLGQIRSAAASVGVTDINPSYRTMIGSDRETLIVQAPYEKAGSVVSALQQRFPDSAFQVAGETQIGPTVGKEIQWNAFWSLFWSLLLMLLYVAIRFEIGYGVGAIAAVVVGLLLTIGLFVLSHRQFNSSMVAAILLVVGYGINDTIVVFDRIREELKLNPTGSLRDIVLRSLNLTLSRTIVTGGTTLLTAITFLVVTTGDVNDIAFTLLIGVLVSTFCSLFVATPVFFWWHKGDRKHVEAHHDIAPKYEWAGSSRASE